MQPQRQSQSATNCHREFKRSIGGDNVVLATPASPDYGDKENRENIDYSERRSLSVVDYEKRISVIENERRLSLAEKDKRLSMMEQEKEAKEQESKAKLNEKDAQLQDMHRLLRQKDIQLTELRGEMDRLVCDKDFQLQQLRGETDQLGALKDAQNRELREEMDRLMSEKDRTLQQLKDEHQKRDATWQTSYRTLQQELLQKERQAERQTNAKRPEEKDFRDLRKQMQDQKLLIESLESQLRRTSSAVSLISPGEFSRMAKNAEAKNGFSAENARLLTRNSELELEVVLIRKEISLLRKRLPADVCSAITNEANLCALSEEHEANLGVINEGRH